MPLQSRVSPFGELFTTPARGLFMGNRGGRLHDDRQGLGARRWVSKQWICCRLAFNDRHRDVWGDGYTELFFFDEVTALAAGHRPCFECRRKDAEAFATLFSDTGLSSARPRASGDPALESRLRGNERNMAKRRRATAAMMDKALHAERLVGRTKRLHRRAVGKLPEGAMIALGGEAFAVKGNHLLSWTPEGYAESRPLPRSGDVDVLTPPSILHVLAAGYRPLWHPSAA